MSAECTRLQGIAPLGGRMVPLRSMWHTVTGRHQATRASSVNLAESVGKETVELFTRTRCRVRSAVEAPDSLLGRRWARGLIGVQVRPGVGREVLRVALWVGEMHAQNAARSEFEPVVVAVRVVVAWVLGLCESECHAGSVP